MKDEAPVTKAMFVDEAEIMVSAGRGGDGCVAFRREAGVPRGGPAGGDGGRGGSVWLQADESYNTLHHLAGHHHWSAENGKPGQGKNCTGHGGKDITICVPPGTLIYNAEHGILIKDLTAHGDRICVAAGGKGGHGNTHFTTAIHQAPRESEPGGEGASSLLKLELKLIADVGLVGKPNAGKSTLLSRMSAARPKVAAYPFTTLYPVLGIVELSGFRRFVMADIPGLIEGAHDGAGLGDEFLRHVERTRVLVHLLDICPEDESDPATNYHAIRRELEQYSPVLAGKREIVVANKMDLTDADEHLARLEKALGLPVLAISGVTGKGLEKLGAKLWHALHDEDQ